MVRTKSDYYQKGESGCATLIGCLFVIVLVIGGIVALFGGESEGTVKYDDCRQIVTINESDLYASFHKFTCDTTKTSSGKVISGTCVHIDTQDGVCITAHVYQKKTEIVCPGSNNYVADDGSCTCNYGYTPTTDGQNCVLQTTSKTTTNP
jgi:hypothetical protein